MMNTNCIWVIIDLVVFIYILYLSCLGAKYKTCNGNFKGIIPYYGNNYKSIILILILFFCLFNKTEGDYFHYQEILPEILSTKYPDSHLEWPYLRLIYAIGNNYFLFRLCIWGTGLYVIYQIFRLNNLNNDWGLFCFTLIALIAIAYVRACVGIGLFYLGYTLILEKRLKKIILGCVIIVLSYFFHKSILLLIALGFIIPFVKINFKTIIAIVISFPFVLSLLYLSLGDFIILWGDMSAVRYFNNENIGYGLGSIIQISLIILSVVFFLFCYLKDALKYKIPLTKNEKAYLKFCIALFYISFLLLSFEYGVSDLATRVREMAYIPFCFLVASYPIKYKIIPRKICLCLLFFFLSDVSYFSYMFYLKSIGSGI